MPATVLTVTATRPVLAALGILHAMRVLLHERYFLHLAKPNSSRLGALPCRPVALLRRQGQYPAPDGETMRQGVPTALPPYFLAPRLANTNSPRTGGGVRLRRPKSADVHLHAGSGGLFGHAQYLLGGGGVQVLLSAAGAPTSRGADGSGTAGHLGRSSMMRTPTA